MRYSEPLHALGQCAIESVRFSKANKDWGLIRVNGVTYPGREHWASIFMDGKDMDEAAVRDGTMRQFSATSKVIWSGIMDDWLDDITELLNDHLDYEVFENVSVGHPCYSDRYIREDITPGVMQRPPFKESE